MSAHRPVRTPLLQRLKRARVGLLPLVIWLAGVLLAGKLWFAGPRAATYSGLAHALENQVNSPVDGELESLLVGLYQTVEAGQPLALLNGAGLDARIDTARAELARLTADMEAERATLDFEGRAARLETEARLGLAVATASLEYPAELRAFHADETALELRLLETRLAITTSELETDRLELALRRAQALAEDRIGPQAEVEDLQKRRALETARTQDLRGILAAAQVELEQALERRRSLQASYLPPPGAVLPDPVLEARLAGWRAALVVQQQRLEELALLRRAYLLRAPASGRVAALQASQGQYLLAGDEVLVLMDSRSSEVALWVPESAPLPPRVGDRFLVARALAARPLEGVECAVQALSPRVELMPQRLWRDARMAEYGRACRLGPVSALGLTPGERVRVDPLQAPDP